MYMCACIYTHIYTHTQFQANPSIGSRIPLCWTDGRIDRHDEVNDSLSEFFRTRLKATVSLLLHLLIKPMESTSHRISFFGSK